MPIRLLDATVAAQIAAGEVVERPASVIKELVENALDAGARRIAIEARGGGLRELKVQDDGGGIAAHELELAFERHATSKLTTSEDLWRIGTLGFRGEALPSIASVAQVICVSRTAAEEVGTELRLAGGEVQSRTPRGCSPGTSFSVRNLFYNTPVRREYLRSEATELSAISAVVQQYALAYPEVRFTLQLEGRLALQTSGDGDLRAVLIELYGLDVARQMLPVAAEVGEGEQEIRVEGLISPPGLTRGSRSYLHLFANRRALQPRGALPAVVEDAYHTMLMRGRHPLVVLNLFVHPLAVDVNVHPTKSEVKFRYAPKVHGTLGRAVREALVAGAGVPTWEVDEATAQRRFELRQLGQAAPSEPEPSAWGVGASAWDRERSRWDAGGNEAPFSSGEALAPSVSPPPTANAYGDASSDAAGDWQGALPQPRTANDLPAAEPLRQSGKLPPLRVVGQVGLTYIIAEAPEGMYLIDQHAAHERITYERLMTQFARGSVESQGLLLPRSVPLTPAASALLLGNPERLAEWGFVLDEWGEGVMVRAVPATLPADQLPRALHELADHLAGRGGSTPLDWREAMLTTLSCHTSVRAGQTLSLEEMRQLLQQLEACTSPRTCPHGRPTMILMTPTQLERQFGR
ncbi:DNA mismatch repair endonuclease MutL [Candidatus Chloroploca sp. M-50]|uniref:DNA mismatch repair protein MutL n=1 Tax=Candidatus Chloroploca mongolica TaxID=2528176 RepID=A0ABS4D6R5_9CHLR|nr:DNA mismatch repair endonuclease MutL [Candidatus Chloroploca mongolica]MBP1465128.1 DNA mismatch repair endonuclease MutL [Candidatus Chloroploca mongolica]